MLGKSTKVEVKYNRSDELALATVIRSKQTSTIEKLWGSADTSPSSKKRRRIDSKPKQEVVTQPEWTCNACTFVHVGGSKIDYLTCEICGSTRLESPKTK